MDGVVSPATFSGKTTDCSPSALLALKSIAESVTGGRWIADQGESVCGVGLSGGCRIEKTISHRKDMPRTDRRGS
ncbi:hypothetical protein GCM10009680_64880 [Streptomyces yatensis]|uniref:Uncharacterized protein n=2 Tax=Streptomyces yatensis TaxID=155177 RepID=A0ABN2IZ15_9ACTN